MAPTKWNADEIGSQEGRLIIITGATSGLGKEAARVLTEKRASVIIGARNMQKAEDAVKEIREEFQGSDITARKLDLSNLASIERFADSIIHDFDNLDVLINNAGVMMCPYSKTADGFEIQMGTNHLGHFALTGRLLPLLKKTKGSRVVVLTSFAHKRGNIDFSDLHWESRKYNTTKAYCDSKLANIYFAYELARKLKDSGDNPIVTVAHPGWTETELQRHSGLFGSLNPFFAQHVEIGVLPTLRAGFDPEAKSRDFYGPCGLLEIRGHPVKVKSSKRSYDTKAAKTLWEMSEELTGISY